MAEMRQNYKGWLLTYSMRRSLERRWQATRKDELLENESKAELMRIIREQSTKR